MFIFRHLYDRPWALFDTDEGSGSGGEEETTEETAEETTEGKEPKVYDEAYVKKLRAEAAGYRKRATTAETKVGEYEEASKTDKEKAEEELAKAREGASHALRLEVALEKAPEGTSPAQIRKLAKRLSGKSREELEADAEELIADFLTPSKGDEETDDGKPNATPREKLRPGAAPSSEPEENDPRKLAEAVPRF